MGWGHKTQSLCPNLLPQPEATPAPLPPLPPVPEVLPRHHHHHHASAGGGPGRGGMGRQSVSPDPRHSSSPSYPVRCGVGNLPEPSCSAEMAPTDNPYGGYVAGSETFNEKRNNNSQSRSEPPTPPHHPSRTCCDGGDDFDQTLAEVPPETGSRFSAFVVQLSCAFLVTLFISISTYYPALSRSVIQSMAQNMTHNSTSELLLETLKNISENGGGSFDASVSGERVPPFSNLQKPAATEPTTDSTV